MGTETRLNAISQYISAVPGLSMVYSFVHQNSFLRYTGFENRLKATGLVPWSETALSKTLIVICATRPDVNQHLSVHMLHKVITWYEVNLKLLSLYGLLDPAEGYENRPKATPNAGITLGLRLIVVSLIVLSLTTAACNNVVYSLVCD